ncbi:MAG: DUF1499 domain-containing protein [Pseudomonadota bacterium]
MKTVVLVLLLLVIAGAGGLFYLGQKSRSGAAPGLNEGHLASCPSAPNCVSSEINTSQDQRVIPFQANAWRQIPAVIEELGGTVTRQESEYLSAEFKSSVFKFTDDVEFRLAEDAVHVRSASRVGYSDMGVNRARVEAIRALLNSD